MSANKLLDKTKIKEKLTINTVIEEQTIERDYKQKSDTKGLNKASGKLEIARAKKLFDGGEIVEKEITHKYFYDITSDGSNQQARSLEGDFQMGDKVCSVGGRAKEINCDREETEVFLGISCNFNPTSTMTSQEVELINNPQNPCKIYVSEINSSEIVCNTKASSAPDALDYINNTFEILFNSISRLDKDFLKGGYGDIRKVFVDFWHGNSLYRTEEQITCKNNAADLADAQVEATGVTNLDAPTAA